MPDPLLTLSEAEAGTQALILILHGGKQRSEQPVDWRSASWQRMRRMQQSISPEANRAGVSTWLLRYPWRGWNDATSPSPVPAARWAIDQVRLQHGDVPIVLLGHSMGARTAIHVADDPAVAGVVALAPWFNPGDPVAPLTGRHLHAAHGRQDRITSPAATASFVRRAAAVAKVSELHDMGPVGHYMLRHVAQWNEFAIRRCLEILT